MIGLFITEKRERPLAEGAPIIQETFINDAKNYANQDKQSSKRIGQFFSSKIV